jgi:hypothetical protein
VNHATPAILVLALALAGCASVADVPLVGVPANAPPRPETAGAYLPVHDVPPPRQEQMLSLDDQTRIAKELSEARSKGKATAASDAAAISATSPAPPPAKAKPSPAKKKAEAEKSAK